MSYQYAHMCRDGHVQIGHNDSENEMCPLCIALAERDAAVAVLREITQRAGSVAKDMARAYFKRDPASP